MTTSNLPHQLTTFVGRGQEIVDLVALLHDPACRLLTLTGPGGIGKTRLAVEVTRRLTFTDGIFFVALQPLDSPDLLVPTIAAAIHLQFYSGSDVKEQFLRYLHNKSLLLVLDNFEHLLDGVQLISEILAHAPDIKVMVTSRETLKLQEEWVRRVMGLPFPDNEQVESIELYSALKLFFERARHIRRDFDERVCAIRVCQLVGGTPLAIELAASWLNTLTCEQIANEIQRNLDFLATSLRNVPERHRSIRAVFDHSWQRMSDDERTVFKQLSVFRGGFQREAAEEVAAASLLTLSSLVDKSWLRLNASGRYEIHELLRQYSEDRLNDEPTEREQTRERHSAYYAEFMNQQWEHLKTHRQRAALDEIEVEIDNVRVAWHSMIEKLKAQEIGRMARSLAATLHHHVRFREGLELFGQAVAALQPASSEKETGIVYGLVLALLGSFYIAIGDPQKAHELAQEGLDIMRGFDDQESMMDALEIITHADFYLDRMEEWKQVAHEGLNLARASNDRWRVAKFLCLIGLWMTHNNRRAKFVPMTQKEMEIVPLLEEGLEIAERLGNPELIHECHRLLGRAVLELGQYLQAKWHFEQALKNAQETGNLWSIALGYMNLANVATNQKDFAEARHYYRQELEIDLEVGHQRWQTDTIVKVTQLLIAQGEIEQAVEILTLVYHHPATMKYNLNEAQWSLDQLQFDLPSEVFAAAVERGRMRDLETTVKELIAEFSQPLSDDGRSSATHSLKDDLTEREVNILTLVADGLSNQEIADRLFLARGTIKWYLGRIYSKLDVGNRTQAIARARVLHLLRES